MKRFFYLVVLLMVLATAGYAQSGCVDVEEIDGSPRAPCIRILKVTNGTLSCPTTNNCVLTISGGGGGSPGGADTNVQYNDSGSFGGVAGFVFDKTSKISLGVAGTSVGAVAFRNATSGTITVQPVTGALGTVTLSLPATTGTLALTSQLTAGTVTSVSFTGGLISVATATTTPAFTVAGTSGGVPYFSSGSTWATSAALAANAIVLGGGAGAAPATTTTGTGVVTALGVNVGSAGAFVTFNGALGTPSSGTLTNATGLPPTTGIVGWPANASGVLTNNGSGTLSWGAAGGGTPGGSDTQLQFNNAGAFGGISGATSNGTLVTFTSGNLLATSPVFSTDITTPIVKSSAGSAIAVTATAPTATTGASQTGVAATLTASPAVASTDTAGAAAGGPVTVTGGAAARLTNGNANGGDINLVPGAGIGTGLAGKVLIPQGTTVTGLAFTGATTTGLLLDAGSQFILMAGGTQAFSVSSAQNKSALPLNFASAIGSPSDVGFIRPAAGVLRLGSGGSAGTNSANFVIGSSTVGSIGTSGVGVFAIANGTAPSSSPADEFQLYSADSAAGDANAFARNEAGEINRLTGLAVRNSSSFAKTTDTTLANITGLTRNVEAGRAYAFTANLQTTAAATGGVKFAVSGTATATSISYEGVLVDTAVGVVQTRATALDTTVCASTTSTAGTCTIKGVIVVNAAGTLTIQFAQNASDGGASTVLVNQYLQLIPIS